MSTTSAPTAQHATAWDRAAILTLGAAACALSYDALQQMAAAIHIRGLLTYLFPLVVDGFIAYGVRALIILRTAPFRARLYVWALFSAATAASLWANSLHAVRLNEADRRSNGLHLGDLPTGLLSTLAPLALAGAVHLYILIARGAGDTGEKAETAPTDTVPAGEAAAPAPPDAAPPETAAATTQRWGGRPADASIEQLVEIGRTAADERGKLSRLVVQQAVKDKGLKMGGERLTEVMRVLRSEARTASVGE